MITVAIWSAWWGAILLLGSTEWVARLSTRRAGIVVIGTLHLALAATIAINAR